MARQKLTVTPENLFLNRRQLVKRIFALGMLAGAPAVLAKNFTDRKNPNFQTLSNDITDPEHSLHYNNFYEFGTSKSDPYEHAEEMVTEPWTLTIEGECAKPQSFTLDDLAKLFPYEERIYRFRCVEGWSMVVPWDGFELQKLLTLVEPTKEAKYVEFISIYDPKHLRGQRLPILDWPYREGLRIDEAMHPLTLMATGLYGKPLPNQNGAPIRLVVPWKYGFKSAKSIVKIRLIKEQPTSTWMKTAPNEYGFYSNVNPNVSHPRWSQAKERPLGHFFKKRTELFNGYDEVAELYQGMDLKKYF